MTTQQVLNSAVEQIVSEFSKAAEGGLTVAEIASTSLSLVKSLSLQAAQAAIGSEAKRAAVLAGLEKYLTVAVAYVPLPWWLPGKSYVRAAIVSVAMIAVGAIFDQLFRTPILPAQEG